MSEKEPLNVLTGCAFACVLVICVTAIILGTLFFID